MTAKPELDVIKQALVDGLRVQLSPQEGLEAFARHQLLAIRFHRAARLNQRGSDRQGQGWCRFFRELRVQKNPWILTRCLHNRTRYVAGQLSVDDLNTQESGDTNRVDRYTLPPDSRQDPLSV